MIYTITLNPALDYVIQVPHFQTGQMNRITKEDIYYGGKGINVSTILHELDTPTCALGFIAGFTGNQLEKGLQEFHIATDFVHVQNGMTRINVKMKSDDETEINGRGPDVSESDLDELLQKVKQCKSGDVLVLSGNIPSTMHPNTYVQVLEQVPEGVDVVVDAEKDLLLSTLSFHPLLIKPNVQELEALFHCTITNQDEIVMYAKKLQNLGARNVLVSMAKDGAMLLNEKGKTYYQPSVSGTVVNSVGAGDSMVAGFISGYMKSKDFKYALQLGTACGAATAFHSGLATRTQIELILKQL